MLSPVALLQALVYVRSLVDYLVRVAAVVIYVADNTARRVKSERVVGVIFRAARIMATVSLDLLALVRYFLMLVVAIVVLQHLPQVSP